MGSHNIWIMALKIWEPRMFHPAVLRRCPPCLLLCSFSFLGIDKREPKVILTLHYKCLRHNRWCFHGIVLFFSSSKFPSFSYVFHGETIILLVGFQVAGILDSIFQSTYGIMKKVELGKNFWKRRASDYMLNFSVLFLMIYKTIEEELGS